MVLLSIKMWFSWIVLIAGVAQGFALPDPYGFSTNQKIRWSGDKIYFPGQTNRRDTDKYVRDRYSNPADGNEIRRQDQNCVLSATPPDPDSQCCGVEATTHDWIVGGDSTKLEQYPWLVHIQYYNKKQNRYKQLCGGFLISGRYVLSAAHCFVGEVLDVGIPVNVILGDYNSTNEGPDCVKTRTGTTICTDGAITIPIERYTVHPKHYHDNNINVNDITLVRLENTVQYSKYVRPICLPTHDISRGAPANLRLYTAGWGAIKQRLVFDQGKKWIAGEYDHVKKHVDLPFRPLERCREILGNFVGRNHICAGGERGRDSCRGDSGGPLMYQNDGIFEAVGIVSAGSGKKMCGTEDYPAIYVKLVEYLDWIRSNIHR